MGNHKIVDNFLDRDDFKTLGEIKLKKIEPNELAVYHNSIHTDGKIITECMSEELIKKLHNNYHKKALELLEELAPNKVNLYDYSEFHIIETGKNYIFPIHRDTPNKLLSGVIYLKPEINKGTFLYSDRNGNNKSEIEWKQNRAFFFSRSEDDSWHSYEADKKNNRLALVYNLMTLNIKDACRVEGISYYKVRARELLNQYLFRYFKTLI